MVGNAPPRNDSKISERRTAEESEVVVSDALGCLRRMDNVPSDIPAAMCVSSGLKEINYECTENKRVNVPTSQDTGSPLDIA
jgi:hypothetical protein